MRWMQLRSIAKYESLFRNCSTKVSDKQKRVVEKAKTDLSQPSFRELLHDLKASEHFDLIVIGSGPAAQKCAINSAKKGKKVAIVDKKDMVGGVCVHTGTIPSKVL